jgi:hypothetical protein
MIRSKKITSAARGEDCTLQILGVCNGNPETVVACHVPDESHGISLKADDICTVHGCSACHDVLDGRVQCPEFSERSDWYIRRALVRTWRALFERGVLKVA